MPKGIEVVVLMHGWWWWSFAIIIIIKNEDYDVWWGGEVKNISRGMVGWSGVVAVVATEWEEE